MSSPGLRGGQSGREITRVHRTTLRKMALSHPAEINRLFRVFLRRQRTVPRFLDARVFEQRVIVRCLCRRVNVWSIAYEVDRKQRSAINAAPLSHNHP